MINFWLLEVIVVNLIDYNLGTSISDSEITLQINNDSAGKELQNNSVVLHNS